MKTSLKDATARCCSRRPIVCRRLSRPRVVAAGVALGSWRPAPCLQPYYIVCQASNEASPSPFKRRKETTLVASGRAPLAARGCAVRAERHLPQVWDGEARRHRLEGAVSESHALGDVSSTPLLLRSSMRSGPRRLLFEGGDRECTAHALHGVCKRVEVAAIAPGGPPPHPTAATCPQACGWRGAPSMASQRRATDCLDSRVIESATRRLASAPSRVTAAGGRSRGCGSSFCQASWPPASHGGHRSLLCRVFGCLLCRCCAMLLSCSAIRVSALTCAWLGAVP